MEITLLSVSSHHESEELALTFRLSDGVHFEKQTLCVFVHQYAELSLSKGPIPQEAFEAVEEAAALCRAVKKGASLLGYGANSPKQLTYKLRRRGFEAEVAEAATAYLLSRGLINEAGDVVALIAQGEAKLWGRARIVSDLYHKGYDAEVVDEACEALDTIDFEENCGTLIRKKGGVPEDREARKRLVAFLIRYGYTMSEIKAAMQRILST